MREGGSTVAPPATTVRSAATSGPRAPSAITSTVYRPRAGNAIGARKLLPSAAVSTSRTSPEGSVTNTRAARSPRSELAGELGRAAQGGLARERLERRPAHRREHEGVEHAAPLDGAGAHVRGAGHGQEPRERVGGVLGARADGVHGR